MELQLDTMEDYVISFNATGTELIEEIEKTFNKFGYSIRIAQEGKGVIHVHYESKPLIPIERREVLYGR